MDIAAAQDFVDRNARPIDRVLLSLAVDAAPMSAGCAADTHLVTLLTGYRNPDGGFGHALEPDLRCTISQPLHTETALALAREGGVRCPGWATSACGYYQGVADDHFRLTAITHEALERPAASHWQSGPGEPTLDRTYLPVALLHWHGADHAWLEGATAACAAQLRSAWPGEAHTMIGALWFAAEVMADECLCDELIDHLAGLPYFIPRPPVDRYGLTPLHFAPTPAQNPGFDTADVAAHLDWLCHDQQDDGGWPVRFQPVGPGALMEWRGRITVEAVRTLLAWQGISE